MTVTTKYFSVWKQDKDMGPRGFPGPGGADGTPGEGVEYPGAGIPVSTGTAWGPSLGIANNTDDYLVTMTGTGFNGEANLTFNGTDLSVNGLLVQNNLIDAQDGSLKHLTITAGDASGAAGTDAGNLIFKAGNAINADSGSVHGSIYLSPGNGYTAGTDGTIYLGSGTSNHTYQILQAEGSGSAMGIKIIQKGSAGLILGKYGSPTYLYCSTLTLAATSGTNLSGDLYISENKYFRGYDGVDPAHPAGYGLTIKGGDAVAGNNNGGSILIYGGAKYGSGTRGGIYFGDGSSIATLPARSAETNNIFYDTTTGKLSYGALTAALVGAIADPGTSVDREILTWNGTTGDAVRVSVGVKIDTNKSVLAEGDVIAYYA